jgi:rubrerythrin
MIKKEELLKILKGALNSEEKGIVIYKKHLESALFWTGIPKEKGQRVKELLEQLAEDTIGHRKTVQELIKKVEGENKNAF